MKYREPKLILSDQVTGQSWLLDHRSPRERVERSGALVDPGWQRLPAVVDGRIQWIVDGYTTTARYPNSRIGGPQADAASDFGE